jgi:proteasome lid subunit RPN8/RPN11
MRSRPSSEGQGVVLPRAVRRAIVDQARLEAPLECCGLLVGRGRDVAFAVACTNVARSETRFRIAPREHIDLRRALRAFSPPLDIVGVYHSHPRGKPLPSPTDVAEAAYPEWVYVIAGRPGGRPALRAYRIREGRVRALPLHQGPPRKR